MKNVDAVFPRPWSIAPRRGKYYGTVILDAEGSEVMKVWFTDPDDGGPSDREKIAFGSDWTPEKWAECNCDSHYESAVALSAAVAIVERINSTDDEP